MSETDFTIRPERSEDADAIAALSSRALGPGRFARTAYRVREGAEIDSSLCLTAWQEGRLVGSIRFAKVAIGGVGGAVLLGPLIVEPELIGRGCGRKLVREGVERARDNGYRLVVLVGDLPYYGKLGFASVPKGQIVFPGPVDAKRILAAELESGALADFKGVLR